MKSRYSSEILKVFNSPIFNQCSTSIPPENLRFSDVFRGYRIGILIENGLNHFEIFGSLHLPPQPGKREKSSDRYFFDFLRQLSLINWFLQ